jgi:D-sedoheptulose 7-phosphate isomerase
MENPIDRIRLIINNSINVKLGVLKNEEILNTIHQVATEITLAYKNKNKLLLCGNGGSAADAQHIAAEFTGRYYLDREPLLAEALHVNTSYLTAVANDYSYDKIYSRYVKAAGREGDILLGFSTSGNSGNVVDALRVANELNMKTVGLTGSSGGDMKDVCHYLINVPSSDTPRIQESHILIGHIICEIVESNLFGQ